MKKIYFLFFLITFCWYHNTQANPIKASDILAKDSTLRAVICQGESYTENGFNIATATAGMMYDTLTSMELGCDSTVYLELTVLPTYDTTVIKTICSCDLPYTWNDVTFNEAGSQATTLKTVNGCDSVVRMTIKTVQTYPTIPDQRSVCETELPLNWDGFYFTEADTQNDTTRTITNCFVVTKVLTVNPIYNLTDTVAICVNELPYIWNNKVFDEAGSKIDTLETVNGCDSIVTLTLTVNPVDSLHFDNETICAGNTYSDHGFTFDAPYSTVQTIHHDTIRTTNTNGCDSIVTLTLMVNPVDSIHFDNETVCAGNTYSEHGFTFDAPYSTVQIIHYDTIRTQNANGCDSIVTLTLTVNPVDSVHFDNETVCAGNTYSDHGFTFDAPYSTVQTIHYDTIRTTNTNGCDSIVTLTLTVNPVDSVHFDNETVCAGNTYSDHGFTFDAPYSTIQTIQYDTIRTTNTNGCDSIVTLILTVNPVDSVHFDNETVCAGNTYSDHGFTFDAPYSTIQTIQYDTIRTTNTNGCDSIVTLILTVNPVDSVHFDNETVCAGNTYSDHGFTFDAPYSTVQTIHYDTIRTTNTNGCDSIVTLTLTVNPVDSVHFDNETVCAGNTYSDHGFTFDAPYSTVQTIHYDTIRTTNTNGCDSIVTLTLTVNPVDSIHFEDTICAGGTYSEHGFTYAAPYSTVQTIHYDTIRTTNTNGCDSIVTLTLTVNSVDSVHFDNETVCAGNTYSDHGFTFDAPYSTIQTIQYDTIRTTNTNGCDSIVTLILTVNPVDSVHFDNETVCAGNTYSDHGFTFDAPYSTVQTIHYDTIRTTNTNGCDSIVTLTLTVNPVDSVHFDNETVCAGNTYSDHGFTFDAPYSTVQIIHYDTIRTTNTNGCDSIVTLTLTVNPVDSVHFDNETVCAGNTYSDHGFTFDAPYSTVQTIHYDTIRTTNANGCDSIVTLTLTVNPSYEVNDVKKICVSALPYTWNGVKFTQAGTQTATLETVNGCDSIVTMNLTVSNEYRDTLIRHICEGSNYLFNDTLRTTTGFYVEQNIATNHCDSITVLHLIVHQLDTNYYDRTICLGNTFTEFGFDTTLTTSGSHILVRTIPTRYQCDSTIIVMLTVNPVDYVHFDGTICAGETYSLHGFTYTAPFNTMQTIHYDTIRAQNVNGCDSIVTLTLTIFHGTHNVTDTTVCDSFTWTDGDGKTYTNSGTYTYNYNNDDGCPSVDTLHLTVHYGTHNVTTVSECGSYTWTDGTGQTYSQSGTYMHSYNNNEGCPSVDTLKLTIWPIPTIIISGDTSFCEGSSTTISTVGTNSYKWSNGSTQNSITINEAGVYSVTATNSYGCTSSASINIIAKPIPPVVISGNTSICQGDNTVLTASGATSYTWKRYNTPIGENSASITINTFGTYTVTGTSPYGCTATASITVTVKQLPEITISGKTDICQGESTTLTAIGGETYAWDDGSNKNYKTVTSAGTYSVVGFDANGCTGEASATVHVWNAQNSEFTVTDTTCHIWNNVEYCETGDYTQTLQTSHGCDSIVTLHLYVFPNYSVIDKKIICESELPITWNGIKFTQAGTQTVTLQTVNGSDSVVTMILTVNPTYDVTDTKTICASELPITWNGVEFTKASTQTATLETVNGCDSVVTMTLTTFPTYEMSDARTICPGELPYTWNGVEFTQAGTQTVTLETVNGCDSVVTMTLTTFPTYEVSDAQTICPGELPYTWNGVVFTEAGTQTATLETVNGCDSVVTMTLTTFPTYEVSDAQTICPGELPYTWNGVVFTEAGTQTSTLETVNGCDSVVTMTLTTFPTYEMSDAQTICPGELPYTWNSVVFTEAGTQTATLETVNGCDSVVTMTLTTFPTYEVSDAQTICPGELPYTWNGVVFTEAGTQTATLETVNGCDSVVTMTLTTFPTYEVSDAQTICPGELPYTWNGVVFTEAGTQTVTLETVNGCDSVVTMTLTTFPTYEVTDAQTICPGELPYTWNSVVFTEAGTQTATLETVNGCDSVVTMTLTTFPTYEVSDAQTICPGELPYTWNGVVFTEAGTQTVTLPTENGCDSVVTMTLTTFPTYEVSDAQTICPSELPYSWNGVVFTKAGTQTVTLPTVDGCDSVVTMTLTTFPTYEVSEARTICPGELPYTWNSVVFTEAGTQTVTLPTVDGCDSVVTMTLATFPTYEVSDAQTICPSELPYFWNGIQFTQAGTQAATLETVNGCDSVVTMTLTVNPTYSVTDSKTICNSELPYTWNGVTFTQASTKTATLRTVNGCDSVVTMTLTVNPTYSVTDSKTICASELPYTWNGVRFTKAGTKNAILQTVNDCDSVVTMTLIVNPTYSVTDSKTICNSELPYTWNGVAFTQASTKTTTLRTVNDCDSVVTMTLIVNPTYSVTDSKTICDSELPYTWNGVQFTQAGTQTTTLGTVNGCDSVVTMTLIVNPTYSVTDSKTICDSELPYTWNGVLFTQADTQAATLGTVNGCDSVVTMTLTVNPTYDLIEYDTICQNELPYTWRDTIFEQGSLSGVYVFNRITVNQCDSTVSLNLTIHPSYHVNDTLGICDNELPYTWNGVTFTQAGTQNVTLQTVNGCDSVVTMTLLIRNTHTVTYIDTCDNSYTWTDGNGRTYTQSGTYTYSYYNEYGCASSSILHLTIRHSTHNATAQSACDSLTHTWTDGSNSTYSESGTYIHYYQNAEECPSTDTLTLTINHSTQTDTSISKCDSYTWLDGNGRTYTQSGTYNYSYLNEYNCPSYAILRLTILESPEITISGNEGFCEGDSTTLTATGGETYAWNNGSSEASISINNSGTYIVTGTDINGCTSTSSATVVIWEAPNITISGNTDFCEGSTTTLTAHGGETYIWNNGSTGAAITVNNSGTYIVTGNDENGCTNTASISVNVWDAQSSEFFITDSACYSWNGVEYCETGDYTQTFQTIYGCDSIVTLHYTHTAVNIHDYISNTDFHISIYPNPTLHAVDVKIDDNRTTFSSAELYDATGRRIKTVKWTEANSTQHIDMEELSSGIYFIRLYHNDQCLGISKVIKQQ